jgi:hypothetical protein
MYGDLEGRTTLTGDLNIFISDRNWRTGEIETVLEGKLLDFVISSNFFSMSISGQDIINLAGNESILTSEENAIFSGLQLEFSYETLRNEEHIIMSLNHIDYDIGIKAELSSVFEDITIERPHRRDVSYVDLSDIFNAIMWGDLGMIGVDESQLDRGFDEIINELSRLGYDISNNFVSDLNLYEEHVGYDQSSSFRDSPILDEELVGRWVFEDDPVWITIFNTDGKGTHAISWGYGTTFEWTSTGGNIRWNYPGFPPMDTPYIITGNVLSIIMDDGTVYRYIRD